LSESSEQSTAFLGDTKRAILELLLDGPKTSGEIASKLQIQKSAVRVHLSSMQSQNTVKSYFRIVHLGRPRKLYELTEDGRELFPRKYDFFLSLILKKIETTLGSEQLKRLVALVADDLAMDIKERIRNHDSSENFEDSLRILSSVSNELGFLSTIRKENDGNFSLISRNCILHKIALMDQDTVCHGFHDRIIQKTFDGKINVAVQLKECIALGDNVSRHLIALRQPEK
jgi:predicted ArsR family transcriptional regulator